MLCNKDYNEKYITLGSLPAVLDDRKNAKHTVKMMGILQENTFEITNASHHGIEKITKWLGLRVIVQTRVLKQKTGIKGTGYFIQGFPWEALRPNAMKLGATFDSVIIHLDSNE